MDDGFFIQRTIRLAEKARGMTSPNPMVGAVIVKDGEILAEDFHRKPGTPHAEALVIQKAGDSARGSVLYVNLEPCCHTGKRTPPCTKSIINAGIAKVVAGMKDPNPKVSGMGFLELQQAGVEVVSGVLEDKAKKLNEAYIKFITTGIPFVTLKIAMTLDGKIATPEGQSKWITGEKARKAVHRLRSNADAVITAIGTVKADDPRLTARIRGGRNPLRIVIDPQLDIPADAKILTTPPGTVIVTQANDSRTDYLEKKGVQILNYQGKLDLNWLIRKLGEMHFTSVLIEGGSSLNSHALEDRIVDKVIFFIAPKIIGGKESFPAVGGKSFQKLEEAFRVTGTVMKRLGEDFLIEGYLR